MAAATFPRTVTPPLVRKDATIDVGNITTVTCLDVTATVNGLQKGIPVHVWAESLTANVALSNAHCSAANTLKFRLCNVTGSDINPASQTFRVVQG